MGDRQKLRFIVLLFTLAWALPLAVAANETAPRVSRFDPLDLGGSLARYEVVEVSYLLRSPQGDLVRISRAWPSALGASGTAGYEATEAWPRPRQVFWGTQWFDRWCGSPEPGPRQAALTQAGVFPACFSTSDRNRRRPGPPRS